MWESQQGRKWRMHRAEWGNVCFRDSPQSPGRSCVRVGGSQRLCDLSWYSSAWIPVCRNTLTCPSNLQRLCLIFLSGNAAELLQLYQSWSNTREQITRVRPEAETNLWCAAYVTVFVVDVYSMNGALPLYCPSADKRLYCRRYQYHDVTIWTNMLIQFGMFRPFISWTATLPQLAPPLSHWRSCDRPPSGFTIVNSGLRAATRSWPPGSLKDFMATVVTQTRNLTGGVVVSQLTASNHCTFLVGSGSTGARLKLCFTFTGPCNQDRGSRVLSHIIQALFISFNCC